MRAFLATLGSANQSAKALRGAWNLCGVNNPIPYDNELFPWRFPYAQATIVCCSCGVFRCVNVSPSTPLRGSLDLLQAARAQLRSRLQQEVQRVVV